MHPPIETRGLTRRYGSRIALCDVTFDVAAGEIVGLVGPNGSGKTTLLKILAGLIRAQSGHAAVFGLDPHARRTEVMERTRFAFAPPPLFDGLTAREHLRFVGSLHPGRRTPDSREIERALRLVSLSSRADDRVRGFSFGMRQRLGLALALLPRPDLLVLDEPTDGLDPMAILELREVLKRLNAEHGITVLLSSHLLVEIDELVDRMLVLREGETVFFGPPADLRDRPARLRLEVDPDHADLADRALRARGLAPERDGNGALFLPRGTLSLLEAVEVLATCEVTLRSFASERPSLERALLERLREAGKDRS